MRERVGMVHLKSWDRQEDFDWGGGNIIVNWGHLDCPMNEVLDLILYKECNGYSWLSIWLYLEWTTIQNWKAHLWSRSWDWEIHVSDQDPGMEILRHSGYESHEIKARRSLSSRSSETKQVCFQVWCCLWVIVSAGDLHKDIGRRKICSSLSACLVELSNS